MKNNWKGCAMSALIVLAAAPAAAQTYPNKPVRLIVPIAPGGQTDLLARLLAEKLSDKWNQPVVVDNRAGASTLIGMSLAAKSPPDGYTLVVANSAMVINPGLVAMPYDTSRDLAPITNLANIPFVLATHASVAANSVQELIALAKSRGKKLTFGSGGSGSPSHFSAELFKLRAGIDALHVPYKGLGQSLVALLGGEIDFLFAGPLVVMQQVKMGKVRALAVGSPKRFPAMPDLPTVAEAGLPGYEAGIWFGVLAPGGTPRSIVNRLHGDIVPILALPDVKNRLESYNAIVIGDTPAAFAAFIKAEIVKWSGIAKKIKTQQE
jgi:tripartite-type tricarboxylate transporter receptor subunit TctC